MTQETHLGHSLRINAPALFKRKDFRAWLNNGAPKFTWHPGLGTPTEFSDVIVLVDPGLNGEGSDSDMPKVAWDLVMRECQKHFEPSRGEHITVRLTNI